MTALALLLVTAVLSAAVQEEMIVGLHQLNRPDSISVGNGYIYIMEGITTCIYDLESLEFVKTFGREGAGPGEIKRNPFAGDLTAVPHRGKVYISSMGKLLVFSREGDFLKEYKTDVQASYSPFADRFFLIDTYGEGREIPVLTIFVTNPDLGDKKPVHITAIETGLNSGFDLPWTTFDPVAYRDRLYVADTQRGFSIHIYDKYGKEIDRIYKERTPRKVGPEYRENTLHWFKTHPAWKNIFPRIQDQITFKTYHPPIHSLFVDSGKIYVFTDRRKNGLRECLVMNLKGEEFATRYLAAEELYGMDFIPLHLIHQGIFYRLVENIEREIWELYRIPL